MLTEVPPWQLPVCGLEVQYEPTLREKRHDVPESLYTLLRRMTAVSVDHRIADATELLAQFRTENKEVRLIENELILVDKIDNARKKMEKQVDGILEKEYHRKMEEERAVKQQLDYEAKLTHKADMVRWMESGNDNIIMNAKIIAVVAGIIAVIIFHVFLGLKFWFFVGGILALAGVIFLLIKKMEKNAYKKSIRNKVAQRVMGDSLEFFNGQRRLGSKRRSRRHDSAWAVTDGRVEMVKIFEIEKDKCRVEYIYMVDDMYYCGRRIRRMDALHPSPKYGELISILFAEKKPGESFFVDEGIG